jgi:SAM-dependent methyltransferase
MNNIVVSQMDIEHLAIIRNNVVQFMQYASQKYARDTGNLLDVAPQDHQGARPFFEQFIYIDTVDINPNSGCTYIGDICNLKEVVKDGVYDYVVCTEVLEHTLQPFHAVDEIWRILKPQGLLFLSTPFNFRIHGPLPDCWRFTEHGLRALLKNYQILELKSVNTSSRDLMPIHYTTIAQKSLV